MSVADILAAARQDDGGGDSPATPPAGSAPDPPPDETPVEEPAADPPAAAPPAAKKPAAAAKSGGARPGVSDILAMARSGDGGAPPEATTPAAKKTSPKPAAKAKAKPAAKPAKAAAPAGPRDTASILAAARKPDKPGPISKAEAARRGTPVEKPKPVLPPMPVKPAYVTAAKESKAKSKAVDPERRGFLWLGFGGLIVVGVVWTLALARFMFPNVRREPPTQFKVGFPGDFAPGQVATKFKAARGVWVVNAEYNGQEQLFALKSVCTHLGCTPNWLEAEQKFKCPCHGSGFYKNGINFEGPAPRPLERYAIRRADDGQVEIDKSRTFQEEMGQWEEPACFLNV